MNLCFIYAKILADLTFYSFGIVWVLGIKVHLENAELAVYPEPAPTQLTSNPTTLSRALR